MINTFTYFLTKRNVSWWVDLPLCLISDIQQIVTDPVQAVNDAVDEVSNLLNKFQGTEEE